MGDLQYMKVMWLYNFIIIYILLYNTLNNNKIYVNYKYVIEKSIID